MDISEASRYLAAPLPKTTMRVDRSDPFAKELTFGQVLVCFLSLGFEHKHVTG